MEILAPTLSVLQHNSCTKVKFWKFGYVLQPFRSLIGVPCRYSTPVFSRYVKICIYEKNIPDTHRASSYIRHHRLQAWLVRQRPGSTRI